MLSRHITITVPSTCGHSPITDEAFAGRVHVAKGALCRLFGGCTVTYGEGSWTDDSGKLVSERVALVTSYHDDLDGGKVWEAKKCAEVLADCWQQDCIAVTTEVGMVFAYPSSTTGTHDHNNGE